MNKSYSIGRKFDEKGNILWKCYKCYEFKGIEQFNKSKPWGNATRNVQTYCKKCFNIRIKERHLKNPDKLREYSKRNYEKNKEKFLNKMKIYWKSNPERYRKHLIRSSVSNAIRDKKLIKGKCSYPNGNCIGKIQAHHWDYSKPLEVVWFCSKHHGLANRVEKLIFNTMRK